MRINKKKIGRLRYFVQIFFFLWVVGLVAVRAAVEAGLSLPFSVKLISLHSICPFGGIVTLYTLITEGSLVRQIHESAVILAGLSLLLAILFGPIICGWVCPFGTVQQWMGSLGRRIFKKRYNTFVPKNIDRLLRLLRYGVLVWVLVMTARSATLVFQSYDPYYALFNFYKSDVSKISLALLGLILLLALFVERPFCKYACPYGAFLGLFNKFRIFKLKRNESTCINCSLCNKVCPMNIDVDSSKVVNSTQCISCLACTSEQACPVDATVRVEGPKQRMTITTKGLTALTLFVLLGGIMLSMGLGWWKTSSSQRNLSTDQTTSIGSSPIQSIEDIRGSHSFIHISDAFSIPEASLLQAFSIADATQRIGVLEGVWAAHTPPNTEVGTDSIRLFVSLYAQIPYEEETGTLLPKQAVEVLRSEGKTADARFERIQSESVALPSSLGEQPLVPVALDIMGKTTFSDLISFGLSLSQIESLLGPISNLQETVKGFSERSGLDFGAVKLTLQEL